MLPVVLVLLVATSALAAPGAYLNIISIDEAIPPKDSGRGVSAFRIDQATEISNEGEISAYLLTFAQTTKDLGNDADRVSQALAAAQTIAYLGTVSSGVPGDACAPADLINTVVSASRSGNNQAVRSATAKFVSYLSSLIDNIVELSVNPESVRFAVGPRGNCAAGGRNYQFEAAWDSILASAPASSTHLVNEQYCAAKRLFKGFSVVSNNAGALLTAVSLPSVNQAFQNVLPQAANFLAALPSGNAASAASALKQALYNSV
ncbi:unnamed protein product [Spodoptera littoralis]|uniref:Fib-L n=1 Tax=Spodoptera littoralis TaxID=7109 RepID=A0A9P0MZZ4_SPOLI|nr:unnamed protein product [Spodoptera littoralis]CAH1634850.1 unnamed protein product [Spodoptera littoralis]